MPDRSQLSGMNVIDMRMHMNFGDAGNAFHDGKDSDDSYDDATFSTVYVDSHDYGPNTSNVRYSGGRPRRRWPRQSSRSRTTGTWSDAPLPLRSSRSIVTPVTRARAAGDR